MAEIFRAPLRIEIYQPRQPVVWQVPNLLTQQLFVSASPCAQRDWPNPLRRPWRVVPSSWRPSDLAPPNTTPNHQDAWPNPLARRQPNEHLTWAYESLELLTQSNTQPFNPIDWDNPIRPRPVWMPLSHRYAGQPVTATIVTDPFIAKDFPNPVLRKPFTHPQVTRMLESVTETNPSLIGLEFPNPIRRPLLTMEFDPQPSLLTTLSSTNPVPFAQLDWPNPIMRLRSIHDLSAWSDVFNATLATVNTQPFAQSDFPNPIPIRYPQQRDFDLNGIFIIEPPPPKLLVMRKTLAAMGTRILSRQKHRAGEW